MHDGCGNAYAMRWLECDVISKIISLLWNATLGDGGYRGALEGWTPSSFSYKYFSILISLLHISFISHTFTTPSAQQPMKCDSIRWWWFIHLHNIFYISQFHLFIFTASIHLNFLSGKYQNIFINMTKLFVFFINVNEECWRASSQQFIYFFSFIGSELLTFYNFHTF